MHASVWPQSADDRMEDTAMHARLTRLTALFLAFLCVLALWSGSAAAEKKTVTLSAPLTLRSTPSEQGAAVATVPAGDMVAVISEMGEYCQVVYEGVTGWASKQALGLAGSASGAASQALVKNSQGNEVKKLQNALKELGFYTSSVDGKYGSGTEKAVSAFQKMNGLPQTGVADAATQALLYGGNAKNSLGVSTAANAGYTALQTGSRGASVKQLQTRLKELGYYSGKIDGAYGSGTAAAVKAFQKKHGFSQTGKADALTQTALYSAAALSAGASTAAVPTPTPLPTPTPAKAGKATYPFTTYTLSSVNLRKQASVSSARILTVPKGAEISVLSLSGDYAKITYNGRTGYIVWEYALIPSQYLPGKELKEDAEARQHYPYLQSGSTGKNVALLQEALAELGFYTGEADGDYGAKTLSAVKAFQKKNDIRQDGMASPELQKLVFEGRPKNSKGSRTEIKLLPGYEDVDMRAGDKGDQVTLLQQRLASLGYFTGTPGRVYDSTTVSAVKKFQKDHGLYVDGNAGAKTRLLLSVLASTPAPAAAPTDAPVTVIQPASTPLTAQNVTVIRSGARGEAVRQLQLRLMALGYYTCAADGVYDADDIQAVRAFQQKNGLTIDGVAGLITQRQLYSAGALPATTAALPASVLATAAPMPTPTPAVIQTVETLKTGSRGDAVVQLQNRLKALGYYTGAADGIYGAGTASAVKAFQRANGLTPDGEAGPLTLSKLSAAKAPAAKATATPAPTKAPAATLLKSGDRGAAVTALQQKLTGLGYLTGNSDGIFGAATYRAVKAFQKKNGLSADGVAGAKTLEKLNSSSAIPAGSSAAPTPTPAPVAVFRVPDPAEVRYANWYSEIRERAKTLPDVVIYDPDSGLHFNLHMFSFGKHADSETPTAQDTEILNRICGVNSWTPKYVWVIFADGRVYIGSIHSHGHEVDHTPGNNLDGHICLHFPRVMTEAEATGPYAVSHQNEINWGWELTKAKIK